MSPVKFSTHGPIVICEMFEATNDRDTLAAATYADSVAATTRVFHDMLDAQAHARARYVEEIKARVQSGTYRPNLKVVAERLLADVVTPESR